MSSVSDSLLNPEVTQQLSLLVRAVSVMKNLSNNTIYMTELEEVKFTSSRINSSLSDLEPISCLLRKKDNLSVEKLKQVGTVIGLVVDKVVNRLKFHHKAIVYNIPDNSPLRQAKLIILKACDMLYVSCDFRKLGKNDWQTSYPLLFLFISTFDTKCFIDSVSNIRSVTGLKHIKIVTNKTTCNEERLITLCCIMT